MSILIKQNHTHLTQEMGFQTPLLAEQPATHPLQKLTSQQFNLIHLLGIEVFKYWGYTTLKLLCNTSSETKEAFFKKFLKTFNKLEEKLNNSATESSFNLTRPERQRLEIYYDIRLEYDLIKGYQELFDWMNRNRDNFLKMGEVLLFKDFVDSVMIWESYLINQRKISKLSENEKVSATRIAALAKLILNPATGPLEQKDRKIIKAYLEALFPEYSDVLQTPQRFLERCLTYTPWSEYWKNNIYTFSFFGSFFGKSDAGNIMEETFFTTISDPAYYPIAPELFTRTPPYNPISLTSKAPQEAVKDDYPSQSQKPPGETPSASSIVNTPIIFLHPTIESLIQAFQKLPVHSRVARWDRASFDVPPDPKVFEDYNCDPLTWKVKIVRHRMPAYPLIKLPTELLGKYGIEQISDLWKIPVTLQLPGQKPFKGHIEVTLKGGAVYHCYFMTDQENDIAPGISAMKKFVPVDSFYDPTLSTVVSDFCFGIDQKQTITIQDIRLGIGVSIHPLKKAA